MYGEISKVIVFSPNRVGGAVDDHCWKYTIEYWRVWRRAWQTSWEAFCYDWESIREEKHSN